MSTIPMCYLTPIINTTDENQSIWEKFARNSDCLLACGKHAYVIISDTNDLTVELRHPSSKTEKLCRVLLLVTIIIPILALAIKFLDRTFVDYQLIPRFTFDDMATPAEIQKIIDAGKDVMTAPAIKQLLDNENKLKEYKSELGKCENKIETYIWQLSQIHSYDDNVAERLLLEEYPKYVSTVQKPDFPKKIIVKTNGPKDYVFFIKEGTKLKHVEAAFRIKRHYRFTLSINWGPNHSNLDAVLNIEQGDILRIVRMGNFIHPNYEYNT